jgi:hypothetical protein
MAYTATLSVAILQSVKWLGQKINDELEKIWKEVTVAFI